MTVISSVLFGKSGEHRLFDIPVICYPSVDPTTETGIKKVSSIATQISPWTASLRLNVLTHELGHVVATRALTNFQPYIAIAANPFDSVLSPGFSSSPESGVPFWKLNIIIAAGPLAGTASTVGSLFLAMSLKNRAPLLGCGIASTAYFNAWLNCSIIPFALSSHGSDYNLPTLGGVLAATVAGLHAIGLKAGYRQFKQDKQPFKLSFHSRAFTVGTAIAASSLIPAYYRVLTASKD